VETSEVKNIPAINKQQAVQRFSDVLPDIDIMGRAERGRGAFDNWFRLSQSLEFFQTNLPDVNIRSLLTLLWLL